MVAGSAQWRSSTNSTRVPIATATRGRDGVGVAVEIGADRTGEGEIRLPPQPRNGRAGEVVVVLEHLGGERGLADPGVPDDQHRPTAVQRCRQLPRRGSPPHHGPDATQRPPSTAISLDGFRSLPFDGARRLGRDVVGHPVHTVDLVDDAARHALEHVVGQPGPVRRHGVLGGDGPDDHRVGVGALVAHHADRADVGEHGERLPDLPFEARCPHLLAHDGVGLLQHGHPLGRDLADDPDAEAGSREGLSPHDVVRQSELGPDGPDLVLEQQAERLDQLELHVLGETADVVVALDGGAVLGAGLDDVGVERPLDEIAGVGDATRGPLEDAHEQLADHLALVLGIGDALEGVEELVRRPLVDQLDALRPPERVHHLLALAEPHEAGVDEHAGELRPDGPVDDRGGHGRVDTAGQAADGPGAADLHLHGVHGGVDHRPRRPLRRAGARLVHEALDDGLADRGVHDLGVELDAEEAPAALLHGRDRRRIGRGRDREAVGRIDDGVEVAHPHELLGSRPRREEERVAAAVQPGAAVLAPPARSTAQSSPTQRTTREPSRRPSAAVIASMRRSSRTGATGAGRRSGRGSGHTERPRRAPGRPAGCGCGSAASCPRRGRGPRARCRAAPGTWRSGAPR